MRSVWMGPWLALAGIGGGALAMDTPEGPKPASLEALVDTKADPAPGLQDFKGHAPAPAAPAGAQDFKAQAPLRNHQELTDRWVTSDYGAVLVEGTCSTCLEDTQVVTTAGCVRHFGGEVIAYCLNCLPRVNYILKGLRHEHKLPDQTRHECRISPQALLAVLETANPVGGDAAYVEFIVNLSKGVQELGQVRAQLARAEFLCLQCGRHSKCSSNLVALARNFNPASFLWAEPCPCCGSIGALANVDNCSIAKCLNCMHTSGEITNYCVVCRRTLRGTDVLFPGKKGLDHSQCMKMMVANVKDPGAVGAYDVCDCPE